MGEWTPTNEDEWDFNRSAFFASAPTYEQMTLERGKISIGKAVAASAAVPGLFQPLQVTDLYEDPVQLVDGGVFDNQGIDALIDARCTHVIVSDAGGQMLDIRRAPSWFLGSALRSSAVQYGRVRELGLERVRSRFGPERLALIHTRRGVRPSSRPWRNRAGTLEGIPMTQQPPDEQSPVDAAVQELLADIRTDLDVFNDVEARSLMLSGYLLTDWEFERKMGEVFDTPALNIEPFVFEEYGALLVNAPQGRFKKLLSAAKSRFFKLLKLRPVVAILLAPVVYGPLVAVVIALTIVSIAYLPDLVVKIPFVGERIHDAVLSFARVTNNRHPRRGEKNSPITEIPTAATGTSSVARRSASAAAGACRKPRGMVQSFLAGVGKRGVMYGRACGGDRRRRSDGDDAGGRADIGGDRRCHRRATRQLQAGKLALARSALPHHRSARSAWRR